jgi:hypothetical protein
VDPKGRPFRFGPEDSLSVEGAEHLQSSFADALQQHGDDATAKARQKADEIQRKRDADGADT